MPLYTHNMPISHVFVSYPVTIHPRLLYLLCTRSVHIPDLRLGTRCFHRKTDRSVKIAFSSCGWFYRATVESKSKLHALNAFLPLVDGSMLRPRTRMSEPSVIHLSICDLCRHVKCFSGVFHGPSFYFSAAIPVWNRSDTWFRKPFGVMKRKQNTVQVGTCCEQTKSSFPSSWPFGGWPVG